jgi:hypothetical protein
MSQRTAIISCLSRTRFLIILFLAVAIVPFVTTGGRTAPAVKQSNSVQQPAPSKFHKTAKAVKDQYIVILRNDTSERDVKSVARELALTYSGTTHHIYKHAIKGFSIQLAEAAAIALSQDPRVEYVEEDGEVELATTQTNVPSWGLDRIDQYDPTPNGTYNYSNVQTGRRECLRDR